MADLGERNLILLGAPGAGKGTQAQKLALRLDIPQISTGDMLRAARRDGTPLGKRAELFMSRGELVPDDVIIGLVEERLEQPDARGGFILDGFPRTIPQAEALDRLLVERGRQKLRVLELDVPEAALMERLGGRISCPKDGASYHLRFSPPKAAGRCDVCGSELVLRADDRPEAIAQRLREYHAKTAPLASYYRHADLLTTIDGVGDPDVVLGRMTRALQEA